VFGGGAVSGAAEVEALLDASGAAGFMTYAGRGLIPPGHPRSFGSFLARPDSAKVVAQADLVVALGSELSEVDLWRDHLGHEGRMIRVDLDPSVLAMHGHDDLALLGDAAAFMRALNETLDTPRAAPAWSASEVAHWKARWRAQVRAERPGVVEVAETLQAAMPEGAMIYSDMTQFAYGAKEVWDMPRPGHWHHPCGFGTLGYALPAAIGGAVARPGSPTCAILGDYGLQYTLPELGTAVELGLSLPILLWDNATLGEIKDAMLQAQIPPIGVVAQNPDFLALARAYGAYAVHIQSLDEIADVLEGAFAAGRPTLMRITPDSLFG